jgi:hypothetical protein
MGRASRALDALRSLLGALRAVSSPISRILDLSRSCFAAPVLPRPRRTDDDDPRSV